MGTWVREGRRAFLVCALVSVGISAAWSEQIPTQRSVEDAMLATILRPDAELVARLDRGDVVTWFIEPETGRDVSFVGLVRVSTSASRFIEALTSIEDLSQWRPGLRAGGMAGGPGWAADPRLFVDSEVRQTGGCRVGKCDFKLPESVMQELALATTPGNARVTLEGYLEDCLLRYQEGGPRELPAIHDKLQALLPGKVFWELVTRPPLDVVPAIQQAYRGYPATLPAGIEERFLWLREHYWRRDVTSLVHVLFANATVGGRPATIHVAMQLYANHYFEGVQVVTGLIESETGGSLIFVWHRVRIDLTQRRLNAVERWLISRNGRGRLRRELLLLRERIE